MVDTSVWIDYFNGKINAFTNELDLLLTKEIVVTGDLILAEGKPPPCSSEHFASKTTSPCYIKIGILIL